MKLVGCAGHSAPLMFVRLDNEEKYWNIAPIGIIEGQEITLGGAVESGNVLSLRDIPDGVSVYNIEVSPGDGGKMVRTSGAGAKVVRHLKGKVELLMPSKKRKILNEKSRATIGEIAGGGRKEKPFMKAGNVWKAKKARGKLYPRTSAVAMNALDHPFGSGRGKNIGKPQTPKRTAPPGRKVGLLRARRTGKK